MKRIVLFLITSLLSTSVAIQPMKRAGGDLLNQLAKRQAQGQGSDQVPMDVLQNHFELSFPNELIRHIMLLTMDTDPKAPWKCIQKLYRQCKTICKRFDLSFPSEVQIAHWMDIPAIHVCATIGKWREIIELKIYHNHQPDRCIRANDRFGFQPINYAIGVKHDYRKNILLPAWDKDSLKTVLRRLCSDEQITAAQRELYLTQNEKEHEVCNNIDNANFQQILSELLAFNDNVNYPNLDGNINCSDLNGRLVTFRIIQQGLHEKLHILLETAQEKNLKVISIQDQRGNTALHAAAQFSMLECMKELFTHNDIDVNAQEMNGNTALHVAIHFGKLDYIKELLMHKDIKSNVPNKVGAFAFHYAAFCGNTEFIKCLAGPNLSLINAQYYPDSIINDKNYGLYTALHLAAEEGHVETVRELIACGADVGLKNQEGKTALDLARESGHQEIVELLEELLASIEFSKS